MTSDQMLDVGSNRGPVEGENLGEIDCSWRAGLIAASSKLCSAVSPVARNAVSTRREITREVRWRTKHRSSASDPSIISSSLDPRSEDTGLDIFTRPQMAGVGTIDFLDCV